MNVLNVELYKKMYLIRRAEEKIQEHYSEDEMKTPMHMSMGGEAIAAGVCHALNPADQVMGTYRSHAVYLAKTGETDDFFAEMYGKVSGIANGKAGSMHLSAPEHGLLCCSAIVASPIPVAMGAAFANQYNNNKEIVAVFFGDGATDAGVFWESLNFACLKELPVIFICEDNGFAVHTRREERHGFPSINKVVSQFNCNAFEEETTDVEIIYNVTRNAVETMKSNNKPSFIRFGYYRYLEHVGVSEDFEAGYRSREDFLRWNRKDPVSIQREKLLQAGVSSEELAEIERVIDDQINKSMQLAKKAGFSNTSELYRGVFKCE